jgi:hypothetical protein
MVFLAPMSNLTKMPFWTSQFGPDHIDYACLFGYFYKVIFTMFLLNHYDDNIIWVAIWNIYYLIKINMKILKNCPTLPTYLPN